MGLLAWIIVGLLAGWLTSLLMQGGSGYGIVGDVILGIIGALVGGFLAGTLFDIPDPFSSFNLTTILIAFTGAVIVLAIVRALSGRQPV